MLCEYRDDNSHYSFLPKRRDPYVTYMSHTEAASTPPRPEVDHVTGNSDHVTTFQFPCDVQVLDTETPDVIYSPRIPRGAANQNGGLNAANACLACKNNSSQIYNTATCPLYQKFKPRPDCADPNKSRPDACAMTSNGAVSTVQSGSGYYPDKDLYQSALRTSSPTGTSQV